MLLAGALAVAGCGSSTDHAASNTTVGTTTTSGATLSGPKKATAAAHVTAAPAGPATFPGPDGVEARWVVEENKKPGTTAWHLSGDQNGASINGFANLAAASAGDKVTLYITTHADRYHVSAYRMGYYGGKGGRRVWSSGELKGVVQSACTLAASTNMVACDNWAPSISLTIGRQFVQGDYLFKLVETQASKRTSP